MLAQVFAQKANTKYYMTDIERPRTIIFPTKQLSAKVYMQTPHSVSASVIDIYQ